ncbi:hypothetical protein H072_1847 [Dactylellina haptotyla CBS 200.50]|uniref:Uncharacterized protein n=1 Tax=Dactylellina haptotyla (strain CBS 200.50) TaxID=1284197 RepID=S8AMN3_DACHA|nr:hypothetical protein H072_1847 [Dactylellina haptotyla CBS 200.50]
MLLGVYVPISKLVEQRVPGAEEIDASEDIELATVVIRVPENTRHKRNGHYAVKSERELVAVDGETTFIEIPEMMILHTIAVGEVKPLTTADDGSFQKLNKRQKEVARRWSQTYWGMQPEEKRIPEGGPPTKGVEMYNLLKENGFEASNSDGLQIVHWAHYQEIRRFCRNLEQQPIYEQAVNLLQRFQRLFNESLPSEAFYDTARTDHKNISRALWLHFGITHTIKKKPPMEATLRTRARQYHTANPDIRDHLTRLDWNKAQDLLPLPPLSTPALRRALSPSHYETPATKTASHLADFGFSTPPSPDSSLSVYQNTSCRTSRTPSENAEYKERHAKARAEWQQDAGEPSGDQEREISPPEDHYGDENMEDEDEWHRGGQGEGLREMLAEGQPGGFEQGVLNSFALNSRGAQVKRRLTAASFQSPTPRREKKKGTPFPEQEHRPGILATNTDVNAQDAEEADLEI